MEGEVVEGTSPHPPGSTPLPPPPMAATRPLGVTAKEERTRGRVGGVALPRTGVYSAERRVLALVGHWAVFPVGKGVGLEVPVGEKAGKGERS